MSAGLSDPSATQWPSAQEIGDAVAAWAQESASQDTGLARVGFVAAFNPDGSPQEGHLDVVLLVDQTETPLAERSAEWDLGAVPVPTQALVFTVAEWEEVMESDTWLSRKLSKGTQWVWES